MHILRCITNANFSVKKITNDAKDFHKYHASLEYVISHVERDFLLIFYCTNTNHERSFTCIIRVPIRSSNELHFLFGVKSP